MAVYHIAYACNDGYAIPTGVSIYSLFKNNKGEELCVHVFSEGISEKNKAYYRQMAQDAKQTLLIEEMPDLNKIAGEELYIGHLSYAAYLRIFLVKLLPQEVERVLWIDGDTIVSGGIGELFDNEATDMTGMCCAGVLNITRALRALHGLRRGEPYYNDGVFLFNLAEWRSHNVYDAIMDEIKRRHGKAIDHDQDFLNSVLSGRIKTLSARFNFMPQYALACQDRALFLKHTSLCECDTYSAEELESARSDVRIYHLITMCIETLTVRPWFSNGNHPMGELWHQYLAQTPWRGAAFPLYTGKTRKSESELHPKALVRLKRRINTALLDHVPLVRRILVRIRYGFWQK